MGFCQISFCFAEITGIEVQGREAIVARKQELRLAGLLGQGESLLIGRESERLLAVALVDLPEHNQWHCQMIDQPQPTIKINCPSRRLETFRLASIGQSAISNGQISIEPR